MCSSVCVPVCVYCSSPARVLSSCVHVSLPAVYIVSAFPLSSFTSLNFADWPILSREKYNEEKQIADPLIERKCDQWLIGKLNPDAQIKHLPDSYRFCASSCGP